MNHKINSHVKIAILGAGAVGAFYGAMLQRAGHFLQYYTRSGANSLSENPLQVQSVWGNFTIDVQAWNDTKKMTPADIAIVSCKSLPQINYKLLLEPILKENTILILLQNGLNTEEKIHDLYPKNTIIAASAFTCINRINYNTISHIDYGQIQLAPFLSQDTKIVEQVAQLFQKANIPVKIFPNHRQLRWTKLLWNIPFNTLSVILGGVTTQDLIESQNSLEVSQSLLEEALLTANAEGVPITRQLADQMIENTKKMKPYKTSMLLDYEQKKEMEVEAILGEPLKIAKKYSIKTPVLKAVYNLISFMNKQNMQNSFSGSV